MKLPILMDALRTSSIVLAILSGACVEMERVPTPTEITSWPSLQPFLLRPTIVTGVYRNLDIDSVVFHYTSEIRDETEFWRQLKLQAQAAGWVHRDRRSSDRGETYETFERVKKRGELWFSSAEELRIAFQLDRIAVAYVQSDQEGQPKSVAEESEGRFADEQIWPRFAELLHKKAG